MCISSGDISIVIQGNVDLKYIDKCIDSLKRNFPEAEFIISTWISCKNICSNLNVDKIIYSEDPGAFILNKENNLLNNINRQLISTKAGIKIASRKYILKFRSDMFIINNNFINIYEQYCDSAELLINKLLIVDYYTRNPRVVPMPYHPSDWMLFGLSCDVRCYYDIPLQEEKIAMWYKNKRNISPLFRNVYALFSAEQHICINFLKKYIYFQCNSYYDCSEENKINTEKFLGLNMVVVNYRETGIVFPKYNPNRFFEDLTILNSSDWKYLYNHYNKYDNRYEWFWYRFKCKIRKIIFFYIRSSIVKFVNILNLRKIVKSVLQGV